MNNAKNATKSNNTEPQMPKFTKGDSVKCLIVGEGGEATIIKTKIEGIEDEEGLRIKKPAIANEIDGEFAIISKDSCTLLDIQKVEDKYFEVVKTKMVKKEEVPAGSSATQDELKAALLAKTNQQNSPTPTSIPTPEPILTPVVIDITEPVTASAKDHNSGYVGHVVLLLVVISVPMFLFFKSRSKK